MLRKFSEIFAGVVIHDTGDKVVKIFANFRNNFEVALNG